MRQVGSARHRIPPVSVFVSLALHALPLTSARASVRQRYARHLRCHVILFVRHPL
jgi:hypothetical protein